MYHIILGFVFLDYIMNKKSQTCDQPTDMFTTINCWLYVIT